MCPALIHPMAACLCLPLKFCPISFLPRFDLCKSDLDSPSPRNWEPFYPHPYDGILPGSSLGLVWGMSGLPHAHHLWAAGHPGMSQNQVAFYSPGHKKGLSLLQLKEKVQGAKHRPLCWFNCVSWRLKGRGLCLHVPWSGGELYLEEQRVGFSRFPKSC